MSYIQTVAQHLREEGIQQGMQAGIYKEKHGNEKRMLQQKANYQFIEFVTGLPEDTIKKLEEALYTQE